MKAIKVMGTVDETGTLSLDAPLSLNKTSRVEVIILVPEEPELDDELPSAIESFRQGWHDVITGNTMPIAQRWDKVDAG